MTGWRRWLRLTGALVLVVTFYFVVPVEFDPDRRLVIRLLLSLLLIGLLTWAVVWQIHLEVVNPNRHADGLLIALVVGVLGFALVFYTLNENDPGQVNGLHTRIDALYFAVTTLLTVGFGDINAAGQTARVLVLVQMVFNVVIIASAGSVLTRVMREGMQSRAERQAELRAERAAGRAEGRSAEHAAGEHGQGRRTHRKPT